MNVIFKSDEPVAVWHPSTVLESGFAKLPEQEGRALFVDLVLPDLTHFGNAERSELGCFICFLRDDNGYRTEEDKNGVN